MKISTKKPPKNLTNWIIKTDQFRANEKLILIYILSFKTCFTSLGYMGRQIGLSRSTVQRTMAGLVTQGWVEKSHRNGQIFEYKVML